MRSTSLLLTLGGTCPLRRRTVAGLAMPSREEIAAVVANKTEIKQP